MLSIQNDNGGHVTTENRIITHLKSEEVSNAINLLLKSPTKEIIVDENAAKLHTKVENGCL
jgi:hypothetical protein